MFKRMNVEEAGGVAVEVQSTSKWAGVETEAAAVRVGLHPESKESVSNPPRRWPSLIALRHENTWAEFAPNCAC